MVVRLAVVLAALSSLAVLGTASAQEPDTERYVDAWILVRLESALVDKRADGSFSMLTRREALDEALRDAGVQRIELALPAASRSARLIERHGRYGFDRTYKLSVLPGSDIEGLVRTFASIPGVEFAEPDYIATAASTPQFPDDPLFAAQYGFNQYNDVDVDAPEAWAITTGDPIVIGVLDTGIDTDHSDLASQIVPGYDFVNLDADAVDDHGHGTTVSSIAAASGNNGIYTTGACWNCRLMPLKVLGAYATGSYSNIADAMVWATDRGVRIFNLSLGGPSSSQTLLDGVRYASDAGVTLVTVTHNDNREGIKYPGRYAETIAVGATDRRDDRADPFCYNATAGSNWGPEIDVVAPGNDILGAELGGSFRVLCGTSSAAPFVTGLVGLMHSIDPSLGREEARHLIRSGAEDEVGRPTEDIAGFDPYHGWGRVNMDRTLRATRAATSLRVEGREATRVFHEFRNPLATSWDFVRGTLGEFTETAAGVDLGEVTCLLLDAPNPSTSGSEDADTPAAGQGFYYLSRFHAVPGAGSLGGSSSNRDRTLTGCAATDGVIDSSRTRDRSYRNR